MTEKTTTLRPCRPNAGFEAKYRQKLDRLINEMTASTIYWVSAAYRSNEPEMAQDESPAKTLERMMKGLGRRWQKRFDEAAQGLAEWFSKGAMERTDAQLRSVLRDGGFSVKFTMTRTVNDVVQASIAENVQLIKSIPQQYLTSVQGSVMRSVQAGRDLATLTKELQGHDGVTRRRAEFIARDQSNKATAAVQDARRTELGITEADWLHSGGGKHPRKTHEAMSGKRYNIREGMWDPAVKRYVKPGAEPGCRCVSKSVMPWRKAA